MFFEPILVRRTIGSFAFHLKEQYGFRELCVFSVNSTDNIKKTKQQQYHITCIPVPNYRKHLPNMHNVLWQSHNFSLNDFKHSIRIGFY